MEQLYKGHRVEVLTVLDGSDWNVSLRIFCQEGAAHTLVIFGISKQFTRYDWATEAGIIAAKNWIDTALRCSSKTTILCAHSRRLREKSRVLRRALHSNVSKSRIIVEQSSALYLKMRTSRESMRFCVLMQGWFPDRRRVEP
jgi:hypothetical protein